MVDFNNDTTISTPAADIMRVLVLQRRNDFIESLEAYNKIKDSGGQVSVNIIKPRLKSLFYEIQATLKRVYQPEEYEQLLNDLESETFEKVLNAFLSLNEWLDKIKLTRIDNKKIYDSTRVEIENKEKNL